MPLVLRPSVLSHIVSFVPLALLLALNGETWPLVVLLAPIGFVIRRHLRMVLDHDGVTVSRWGTTSVPWSEVRGFEPGPRWTGGTRVLTADGSVLSVAPASRFAGRASAEQIERLEAIRRARQDG